MKKEHSHLSRQASGTLLAFAAALLWSTNAPLIKSISLDSTLVAGLRALGAAVLAPRLGLPGIAWACAFGWCMMLLFEVPYYFYTCKKHDLP